MKKEDQPDTRALIQAAFGTEANDILMNNTTGRYLSDMIEELIASRLKQDREARAVQQDAATTLMWVEGGFDKRICHDAEGKVRGQIERSVLHGRWAAVADASIGEYMTEAQAKAAVERAAAAMAG